MPTVSVIVPGAGGGRRFGPGRKILQPLAGEPVFLRALRLFATRDEVRQLLLVVAEADRATIEADYAAELSATGTVLVTGGATRTESVRNALAHVDAGAELICVHDAARPCTPPDRIDAVFAAAGDCAAALLAVPVDATCKRVDDERRVIETVDRIGLWAAQTPQVFAADLLRRAYRDATDATDDAALVERLGHAVRVVPGDARNVKITTPDDLALAEAILGAGA
ncbi:MAG: 2-C-methyl-D-erythritol 4-phosphate cytidylyltransferase [Phycisphaerae bacterium]|nr:2-C-methyl-D-erythritol 4-phosphate cytidylyltransferase [Phycisphaerae bacterium]